MAKPRLTITIALIFFALSAAIIVLNQSPIILFLKNSIEAPLKPFELIFTGIAVKLDFWQSAFFNIKNLKESNGSLMAENLELYGKLAQLRQLEEENAFLREELNMNKRGIAVRSANIIGRSFQDDRSFVIDKGTKDGIGMGMTVAAPGNIIIGRVVELGRSAAKVQTIVDTQSKIAAITEKTGISGLARGLGSGIIFDLIAKTEQPENEELIISSGTDGIWPKGFVIGKIGKFTSKDTQLFNASDIKLLAKLRDFNSVFIILDNQ